MVHAYVLGTGLNGESSYRQALFTSRKGVPSSQLAAIETKIRAFIIISYLNKNPLDSRPGRAGARALVGHQVVACSNPLMPNGSLWVCPQFPHTLGICNVIFRFFQTNGLRLVPPLGKLSKE